MKAKVTKNRESEADKVYIPGHIDWRFADMMSSLDARIAEAFIENARQRKGIGPKHVTEEDVLQAMCEVLPQFVSELEQTLKESARNDARIRRAS